MGREAIAEGVALVSAALSRGSVGAYQLQAAIAAVHDEAPRAEDTDWPQILALYGVLLRMSDNPMVALNHAIATAMVGSPRGARAARSARRDERLAGNHRLDAVRAHLLERAGDRQAAIRAVPRRGRAHDEHAGAQLPADARGAAQRVVVISGRVAGCTSSGSASACSNRMRAETSR